MAGEMAERVGARIRERRLELGMKQRELADMLGSDAIDNQRISDWERGVNRPSDRYMEKLASALERDVSWFFREDADMPTPDLSRDGAVQDGLADRLDAIEQALAEAREERQEHAATIQRLLKRQDAVLHRIEQSIQREEQAKKETEEATRRLLAAADTARRELRRGTQSPELTPGKPAT
jgi:transcriptional regulator with XRE-family HTH domain